MVFICYLIIVILNLFVIYDLEFEIFLYIYV